MKNISLLEVMLLCIMAHFAGRDAFQPTLKLMALFKTGLLLVFPGFLFSQCFSPS